MSDATLVLKAIEQGDIEATTKLLPLVYDELRKIAQAQMRKERFDHTLQPTALVHEAYLRLLGDVPVRWDCRGHFFAAASEAMRRILIEHARHKLALRNGGGHGHESADDTIEIGGISRSSEELIELDSALAKLAREHPVNAELVKLIYFAGLSLSEAGAALGVSRATAHRYWTFARAWLQDAIDGNHRRSQ